MTNITIPGVTLNEEAYKGFLLSWQEPPIMGYWSANVASNDLNLLRLMKQSGSKVIEGQDRAAMLAAARKYIDGLLEH